MEITRTDTARDRWWLTYNKRAQLSEDTKVMYGIVCEQENDHKDSGSARMRRDEADVRKLVAQFDKYKVFRLTTDLVAVTTGEVASDEIKHDLLQAQAVGNTVIKNFVRERLITKETKFHQKLKTFETLYSFLLQWIKIKLLPLRQTEIFSGE